jgi:hypothetical protein
MANYTLNYQSDLGVFIRCARLSTLQSSDGAISPSARSTDNIYLPQVFREAVDADNQGCTLPIAPRGAKVWITQSDYQFIPCPFAGGSAEFDQFFSELEANTEQILITLEGERVNRGYTALWVIGELPRG